MTKYDTRTLALAVGLSCLAGYVDASGFLATGGVFVSFMSGNSTRLSIGLAEQRFAYAGIVIGVILLFVLGVMAGSVVSRFAGEKRKPRVLLLVGTILIAAATCHTLKLNTLSTGLMVLAMGAENAVFQRDGEVSIGLTYMTGTLVKLGQQLTAMFFGGPKDSWWPYAVHWLGLVTGALLGAWGHKSLTLYTLWPAVIVAFLLCFFASKLQTKPHQR